MKNKRFLKCYLLSSALVLALSFYPLYMGGRVVADMLRYGSVLAENYPKYIIPYTPISLAVIFGTLLMPLALKLFKKYAFPAASLFSLGIFLLSELLFEKLVIVTQTVKTTLESWQMYMCYVTPESYTTQKLSAQEVLVGEYHPAFKLHFYLISALIIVSVLKCIYDFAEKVLCGSGRKKLLFLQSVSCALFLAMCVFACFTAFYRTGSIQVSPLSALLMAMFFILLGLTAESFCARFTMGKKRVLSCLVPSVVASFSVVLMYVGELILLGGRVYRFGNGVFFDGIAHIVLSPCDFAIIFASGIICYILLRITRVDKKEESL